MVGEVTEAPPHPKLRAVERSLDRGVGGGDSVHLGVRARAISPRMVGGECRDYAGGKIWRHTVQTIFREVWGNSVMAVEDSMR